MILIIILFCIIIISLTIFYTKIDNINEKLSEEFSEDLFNVIKKHNYKMIKEYSKLYNINYIINNN